MVHNGLYAVANHIAHPKRSETESCNANHKGCDCHFLVPRRIVKLEVCLIGANAIHYLTNHTQDEHGGNDNAGGGKNCENTVKSIGLLE